jgi:hypothetical protein
MSSRSQPLQAEFFQVCTDFSIDPQLVARTSVQRLGVAQTYFSRRKLPRIHQKESPHIIISRKRCKLMLTFSSTNQTWDRLFFATLLLLGQRGCCIVSLCGAEDSWKTQTNLRRIFRAEAYPAIQTSQMEKVGGENGGLRMASSVCTMCTDLCTREKNNRLHLIINELPWTNWNIRMYIDIYIDWTKSKRNEH